MRLWTGVGTGTREDEEGEGGKLREEMERESCAQTLLQMPFLTK